MPLPSCPRAWARTPAWPQPSPRSSRTLPPPLQAGRYAPAPPFTAALVHRGAARRLPPACRSATVGDVPCGVLSWGAARACHSGARCARSACHYVKARWCMPAAAPLRMDQMTGECAITVWVGFLRGMPQRGARQRDRGGPAARGSHRPPRPFVGRKASGGASASTCPHPLATVQLHRIPCSRPPDSDSPADARESSGNCRRFFHEPLRTVCALGFLPWTWTTRGY